MQRISFAGAFPRSRPLERLFAVGACVACLVAVGCGERPAAEPTPASPAPRIASAPESTPTARRDGLGDEPVAKPPSRQPEFVASETCAGCHVEQFAAWRGSHHDLAIQLATESTVLGDFDTSFEHFGVTTSFSREGDRFRVETEGPDGESAMFDVKFTFGVDPLQQYLIDLGDGKVQSLTVAWDVRRRRWFSLYPDERIEPGDPLHWTGRLQRWNTMCAECHSTELRRGYSVKADAYEPTYGELDVGCQACHGAGSLHVEWATTGAQPGDDFMADLAKDESVPASVGLAALEIDTCAPCHSRRSLLSAEPKVGEPFLDHYRPALLRPPLYHVDGQVRGEVYVYGSFVQSLMHRRGVRCSDCHDPHSATLRTEGDAVCLQCHSTSPNPRFPTLAARSYDTPAHHFHPQKSTGARCVSCHMPSSFFMIVDERHDHSLRIPRPDLSDELGTPNPCTGCHADRDSGWAARELAGRRPPGTPLRRHYGEALARDRRTAESAAQLAGLATNLDAPAIARATAVELLQSSPASSADVLAALLSAASDESALVRAAAIGALEQHPSRDALEAVLAALDDERRVVRIEAGRVLGAMPEEQLSAGQRRSLRAAVDEFREAQLAIADTPGAHLNLGILHGRRGHTELASEAYRTAIRLAPEFVPARVNLANLYNTQGRNDDAEEELRAALATIEKWPPADGSTWQQGEIHYSLGLLLAESGRLEKAEAELGQAAAALPDRARVHYNHGLALEQLGRTDDAERVLEAAASLSPNSPEIQNALAILHLNAERPDRAQTYAERAFELAPTPQAKQLLDAIEAARTDAIDPPPKPTPE